MNLLSKNLPVLLTYSLLVHPGHANGLTDREKCLLDALDCAGEANMVGEI